MEQTETKMTEDAPRPAMMQPGNPAPEPYRPRIEAKDGVSFRTASGDGCPAYETFVAMIVGAEVYAEYRTPLVVTALFDGVHMPKSLHYVGRAVDVRTRNLPDVVRHDEVAAKLREALGDDYDVVLHKTHIHIEYDPKG